MVDIQAFLNTIYFIIAEISTLDTLPASSSSASSSSDLLLHEQLDLLLSSYPYLSELLQSSQQDSSAFSVSPSGETSAAAIDAEVFPHLLIYEHKFFKFLCNFNLEAKQYSKVLLYFNKLYDLWTKTILPKPSYLSIVLSIEETNMNPLYNPYKDMQEDLDYHGYYSCNISYYDHLQHQQHSLQRQTQGQQQEESGFDDVLFNEIVPINAIEKQLLREIYEKFPINLSERIRSGREAIELSIAFFDLVSAAML
jgi:hypothetical protein